MTDTLAWLGTIDETGAQDPGAPDGAPYCLEVTATSLGATEQVDPLQLSPRTSDACLEW